MIKFTVQTDPDIESLVTQLEGDVESAIKFGMGHLIAETNRHNSAGKPTVGQAVNAYLTGAKNKKTIFRPGAKHPVKRVTHKGYRPNPFSSTGATDIQAAIQNYLTAAGNFGPSTSCITGCHAPSPAPVWQGRQPFSDWDDVIDILGNLLGIYLGILYPEYETPSALFPHNEDDNAGGI
ncbi:MAG: hypothetical protein M0033_02630 [Nitrospiraceae bacterium]|nr:hypothetical protein [Nitrospiraceae bacterium]